MLPHPDDIVIHMKTGLVELHGPMTKEEKADWDKAHELKKFLRERIAELKEQAAKKPRSRTIRRSIESVRETLNKVERLYPG